MPRLPVYFSETYTVGSRTYLMEVRRSQRGQKYFIITRTDVKQDEQQPVIIFDGYMTRFAGAIDRATRAMVNTVSEVDPEPRAPRVRRQTQVKKPQPAAKKAAPTKKPATPRELKPVSASRGERPNQGKRWTEEHDSILIIHFKNGMPTDELAKLLGRGEFSIGVRLAKLGLGQPES